MTTTACTPLPAWVRLAGETYLHAPTGQRVVVLDRVFSRRRRATPRYLVRPVLASAAPFVAIPDELHTETR